MLTHHRKSVCLSLVSTDNMPVWSVMETPATLYQKDRDKFHLLLSTRPVESMTAVNNPPYTENTQQQGSICAPSTPQVLWLEISPSRVILNMQGGGKLSYRHCWQQGVSGVTRYWLPAEASQPCEPIRLKNVTRSLILDGYPLPERLRVEYELWTPEVQLGSYILDLQVKH
jgi:hypothetical protein